MRDHKLLLIMVDILGVTLAQRVGNSEGLVLGDAERREHLSRRGPLVGLLHVKAFRNDPVPVPRLLLQRPQLEFTQPIQLGLRGIGLGVGRSLLQTFFGGSLGLELSLSLSATICGGL